MDRGAWQATVGGPASQTQLSKHTQAEQYFIYFKTFNFILECSQLTNNIVTVSGEQGRDSAHTPVSILPQTALSSRLPHNIEQSSLWYTVGPCWFSILNKAVYMSIPNSLTVSLPHPSPSVTISSFSKSFLFCK